jgi:hypothetical protein
LMPLVVYMRPVMVKIIVLEGYEDPIDHRRHAQMPRVNPIS